MTAIQQGSVDTLKVLLSCSDAYDKNWLGFVLVGAVADSDLESATLLLDHGANIDFSLMSPHPQNGLIAPINPLVTAISHEDEESFEFLLARGAGALENRVFSLCTVDVNVALGYPLHVASFKNNLGMVKRLLHLGASASLMDPTRCWPLLNAMMHKNIAMAEELIDAGADPSGPINFNLAFAITQHNCVRSFQSRNLICFAQEMVDFLVRKGAHVDVVAPMWATQSTCPNHLNFVSMSMLNLAVCCTRNEGISRLLLRRGAVMDMQTLMCADTFPDGHLMRFLTGRQQA